MIAFIARRGNAYGCEVGNTYSPCRPSESESVSAATVLMQAKESIALSNDILDWRVMLFLSIS